MLEHKGIEHRVVELLAGLHPLQVRAAGFRGATVPAADLAMQVLPRFPGPIPRTLPPAWL